MSGEVDIVERLRERTENIDVIFEAADEIERLRSGRDGAIREAAAIAEDTTRAVARGDFGLIGPAGIGANIAAAIRSMLTASKG